MSQATATERQEILASRSTRYGAARRVASAFGMEHGYFETLQDLRRRHLS